MKSKILLLSVLIILPSFSNSQNAWNWQQPPATSVDFFSSYFLNQNTGWFAGEGTVVKTTNGGINWINSILPVHVDWINSVSFGSEDVGIATGYNKLYKTVDGGCNWFSPVTGTYQIGTSYGFMISESTGWIAGKGVIKSTNGFASWFSQPTGDTAAFRSLYFLNALTGWLASENNVYKTVNGGNSWIKISSPLFLLNGDIQFVTENTGWLVSERVLKTTNGGINWFSQTSSVIDSFYDIFFLNEMTGWAAAYNSGIYFSSNGGSNWNLQNSIYLGGRNTLYFDSTLTGYIAGDFGSIYKSSDGGLNWTDINQGFRDNLFSTYFINSLIGWTVGNGGIILKTTSGGLNWFSQNSGVSNYLYSVFFISENDGWAAGESVLKTTNSGLNWMMQSTGADIVKSVFFISESTGWMAGGSKLLKTTDSGVLWTVMIDNGSYDFNTVFFISEMSGWVSDFNGKILRTTNGGLNWNAVTLSPPNNIKAIFFPTQEIGFAACVYHPQIYKSTDSGNTWQINYIGANLSLSSLTFINVNTGYMIGDRGEILKTTNSGLQWNSQQTGTYKELYSVCFPNDSTGWITGAAGIILHTSTGGNAPITGCGIIGWDHLPIYLGGNFYSTIGGGTWELENIDSTNACIHSIVGDTCIVNAGDRYGKFYLKYIKDGLIACVKTIYVDITLPVELSSFISTVKDRNVTLIWSTSSEQNNAGFEIQRKSEKAEWIFIGFVKGHGNSQSYCDYSFEDKNLNPGKYSYRLRQTDFNGNSRFYDLNGVVIIGLPEKFSLSQNYPNPFNPETKIEYSLPFGSKVNITVYDVLGKEIKDLVNEYKDAGYYSVNFDGNNFASGIYFFRIKADYPEGVFTAVRKMLLIK